MLESYYFAGKETIAQAQQSEEAGLALALACCCFAGNMAQNIMGGESTPGFHLKEVRLGVRKNLISSETFSSITFSFPFETQNEKQEC